MLDQPSSKQKVGVPVSSLYDLLQGCLLYTSQAVLAARIDKLPATEKRLLQEAAVVGHDFSFTLLQAISGLAEDDLRALLDDLQAAEFLYTCLLYTSRCV